MLATHQRFQYVLTGQIASGNVDYLKIHLAGLRQMVTLRNNFADVPPLIRYQVSWYCFFINSQVL